jgi:hypothetical protein
MTLQSMLSLSWVWPLIHLALSPAFAACSLACSVTSWAYRTWRGLMQLPYTTALVIFAASELLAGDAVAFLSSKPSTRQQVGVQSQQPSYSLYTEEAVDRSTW